jgi:hypothetical protein
MKRTFTYLFLLAVIALIVWLARHPKHPSQSTTVNSQPTNSTLNEGVAEFIHTNSTANEPVAEMTRPPGMDNEGWRQLLLVRKILLEQNKPVEFYARVVDQDAVPLANARLKLNLSYINEELIKSTNFLHMGIGSEVADKQLEILSDIDGWIRLTGVKGTLIRVLDLDKEGYSFTMPQIDSFSYGPERSVGNVGMEAAFDPAKGYIFHLQRIVGTNNLPQP